MEVAQGHEQHQHRRALGQGVPVDLFRHLAVNVVAGDEGHGFVDAARGQRNPGIGQPAQPGRDSGNHPERHRGFGERLGLLGAAAEDHRIAALQPQHPLSQFGLLDHQGADVFLLARAPAAPLADIDLFGFRPGHGQSPPVDQRVVEHGVGATQGVEGVEGQQAGIARSGPGQPHPAGFEHRKGEIGRGIVGGIEHAESGPLARRLGAAAGLWNEDWPPPGQALSRAEQSGKIGFIGGNAMFFSELTCAMMLGAIESYCHRLRVIGRARTSHRPGWSAQTPRVVSAKPAASSFSATRPATRPSGGRRRCGWRWWRRGRR